MDDFDERTYSAPELFVYGPLGELTRGNGVGDRDAMGGGPGQGDPPSGNPPGSS